VVEDFWATHRIGETLVRQEKDANNLPRYRTAEGTVKTPRTHTPAVPLASPVLVARAELEPAAEEAQPEEKPTHVSIHADAARAVLHAATWPEWACAGGYAESCRGDSATVLNKKGPNGEKIVRVTTVDPGRISHTYEILVPESVAFEVA